MRFVILGALLAFACDGDEPERATPDAGALDAAAPLPGADAAMPARRIPDLLPAQAARRFVFAADAANDVVFAIDGQDLTVDMVQVCAGPTLLAAVPSLEAGLVLCEASSELGLVQIREGEAEYRWIAVDPPGANRLDVAPDGAHAVLHFVPAAEEEQVGAAGSYDEVTVVTLGDELEAVPIGVGFRPRGVLFGREGAEAYVLSDDGLHRVALDETLVPGEAPAIPLGDWTGVGAPPAVLLSPRAPIAVLWREEALSLDVVELDSGALWSMPLPATATDVRFRPDGSLIVVLGSLSAALHVALPEALERPEAIVRVDMPGERFRWMAPAPASSRLVLYDRDVDNDVVVVLDLSTDEWISVPLSKGVRSIEVAPGGEAAMIIHSSALADEAGVDDPVDRQDGYSVLDLSTHAVRLHLTGDAPIAAACTDDGGRGFVALPDRLDAIDMGSLRVSELAVPSAPTALGMLPDTDQLFAVQGYRLGRITFVHVDSLEARTLTDFALAAEVTP